MMRDVSGNQNTATLQSNDAVCCCSRLVALALDEEGFRVLISQDLRGCALGSVSLRNREEARSDCATIARAKSFLWWIQ
jgi:hypothetical protein